MDNLVIKEKKNYSEILKDNIDYILPVVFYIAGLLIGTLILRQIGESKLITDVLQHSNDTLFSIFINKFCLYFSIFMVSVLLGLCLIGFPFVNIIPMIIGISTGVVISYYYSTFIVKGIGYCLLMVTPEISAFSTIIIYTIKNANELSKFIFSSATNKNDTADIDIKLYLKTFIIYGIIVALISFANSLLEYLLSGIVNI